MKMFAVLLASLGLAAGLEAAGNELAQGKILVADRRLADPNFSHTVVYLITYDDEGAVGLILNRETDARVSKLLNGIQEAAHRQDLVFEGGPVEKESILALYRTTLRREGARRVQRDVYAVLDEKVLKEALKSGADRNTLRFYTGYAGWGSGQLDSEVDAGAWIVMDGDARTVFDEHPETLWDRLIRRKDESVARLAIPPQTPPASDYRLLSPGTPETGPTYASSRPAVIAPIQHASDASARPFAVPFSGTLSRLGSPNTLLRICTSTTRPIAINTSLI